MASLPPEPLPRLEYRAFSLAVLAAARTYVYDQAAKFARENAEAMKIDPVILEYLCRLSSPDESSTGS